MKVIKDNTKLLTHVHIIGHSLGAHIAGFAGKHIIELTNGTKVGRITGNNCLDRIWQFAMFLLFYTIQKYILTKQEKYDIYNGK